MYNGDIKMGDKFELVVPMDGFAAGTVVEVYGFDCDNWPHIRDVAHGTTSCPETNRFRTSVKKYDDILENKWIAWNWCGSTPVATEAAAKEQAEEMVRMYGGEAYIAKAENMVEHSAYVWHKR